ncbi:hypothetical protein LTS16_000068 [Friedmanniomyces endolithicus]|uniref:Ketoreductase (KR) domain-containing protein n=2 Tax=Friedmanniomyces endolithicus TaxID=329885 RepID=A0AAN6FDK5_9PEZI|nr:hypothetical protein LTS09_001165 [Friedmanniomyces endolithicus]KAK0310792.1 hypothetical protein LTR82_014678 [Friedmanniomyces endolithicus]KAK0826390.1 hypothetical protein LTR73_006254 [Friedmanniomyces endolithicus]KAK0999794.1 hypothetical protein LTS01_005202 [Friedmanniomyces endolithicus]KAK1054425.1 hypothetical protein LTS16_000068 [Friedmanniomyces endolithicus]
MAFHQLMTNTETGFHSLLYGANIEMVSINDVREANAKGKSIKGLVCVFVGGTGGIGASTAQELFRRTTSPRAYIVGRSPDKGEQLCKELKDINPEGEAFFIEKDISILKDVDEVCDYLKSREPKIHCLFLTAGYMTLQGRRETVEGLDKKMSVNYYSRMRFIFNLIANVEEAAAQNELARVITVLAAGSEGDVRMDDLGLEHNFTLHACLAHCVVMTDFMVEQLAVKYPSVSFSHSYPGTVKTGIANQLTGPVRLAVKVLYAVMTPWILNVQESGERHFFQMSNQCYPSRQGHAVGIPAPEDATPMKGSNNEVGSGAYLLDWDCKSAGDSKILTKYRELGLPVKVWEHTLEMFQQAERLSPRGGKRAASSSPEGSRRRVPDPVGWRAG